MKRLFKSNSIKQLGLIEDQRGIINRYMREKEHWDIHLNKSKTFISKCAGSGTFSSIAILGSGWLLDVPVDSLSKRFDTIYLIDIFHPKQIKHKLRKLTNIEYITIDATGGLVDSLAALIRKKQRPDLGEIEIPSLALPFDVDCVVSLNLLNQLDILLIDSLTEHFTYPEQELTAFRKAIQQAHIDFLEKHHYICIFDYRERVFNELQEQESERETIFANMPRHKISKEWLWKFDSQGMYYDNKTVEFDVRALSNC